MLLWVGVCGLRCVCVGVIVCKCDLLLVGGCVELDSVICQWGWE